MLSHETEKQIKQVLANSIQKGEVAGANILVIENGHEVFYHQDGYENIEKAKPIERDTIFRLYSMTKPITAAAAMILFERGLIDLFDPVSRFLPGFEGQKVDEKGELVPAMREVTIKDLLSMTSGLVYPDQDTLADQATAELFEEVDQKLLGDRGLTTLEVANRLGKSPLAFQPGRSWQYGTSADVLGAVIEVASGQRFGAFLEKEIFKPLAMKDTGFWVPQEKRHRLASIYETVSGGVCVPYSGNHLGIICDMDRQPVFESGGAGLVSTVDDYAKFAQMLMYGESESRVQILKARTREYFTTSTLQAFQQDAFDFWHTLSGHSYGNLMRVLVDKTQAGMLVNSGEYGWDGWLGCYFCNCPEEELTLLIMMQKKDAGTTSLTRKLINSIKL